MKYKQGNQLAELIVMCKLIIWDKALMMRKYYFQALDRTMRGLLRFTNPYSSEMTFSEKTIVFGGGFRQILLVISRGNKQDIVGQV